MAREGAVCAKAGVWWQAGRQACGGGRRVGERVQATPVGVLCAQRPPTNMRARIARRKSARIVKRETAQRVYRRVR